MATVGARSVPLRRGSVRTAVSDSFDPKLAVREIVQALGDTDAACVIFFCSPQYDLHALGQSFTEELGSTQLLGCTTAGEISGRGITANSIAAIALDKRDFAVEVLLFDDLSFAGVETTRDIVSSGLARLEDRKLAPLADNSFAFSLLDGLSTREELMLPVMYEALAGIPLFGGSAADGMDYRATHVFCEGEFRANAAAVAVINTRCPFHILSSHHFAASTEKLVVTRADPEKRVVLELNAEPAAPEYCRVMGLSLDDLSDATFACNALGVQLGENLYARSIRQVNDDLSLTFFCAIDNGIILTKLEDTGLLEHFKLQMDETFDQVGEPQVIIGSDCIHRLLEADSKHQLDALAELYRRFRVVGFNTYGEQRDGLHINHSFTGIAIGYANE